VRAIDKIEGRRAAARIEWPTVALALGIYVGWLGLTYWHRQVPLGLLVIAGGWVTAWHGSLQHEVIHGHPTAWPRFNSALAMAPLSLWLPLCAYRQSHMAHHATEHLTHPDHDPESRYLTQGEGLGHALRRLALRVQGPLIGRLVAGPLVQIAQFLAVEARAVFKGELGARARWARHAAVLAPLLLWLRFVCHLPLTQYFFCFVYPAGALSLLRSFAEHRAGATQAERVAVVERAPVLGLLFLNNNLHIAHHAWPAASWYELPRLYAANRGRLLSANGGLVYDGYLDVARRFLLRPHDRLDHAQPSALATERAA
jgi:fatty acid desaturase